jgi:hypothetical protein
MWRILLPHGHAENAAVHTPLWRLPDTRSPTLPPVSLTAKIGISLGVFALTVALAELFGAANLGTALGIGQVVFGLTVAVLIIWF